MTNSRSEDIDEPPHEVVEEPHWLVERARELYDGHVRHRLPPRRVRRGPIDAYDGALFDFTLTDDHAHEIETTRELERLVEEGDRVKVVGGGCGVTATVAALAGAREVEVAEAARQRVKQCRRTAALHDVDDRINVWHNVVGEAIDVWGSQIGAPISPAWVNNCDVLEMDCEGAELSLLDELTPKRAPLPRVIIVETHGQLGSPTAEVREKLEDMGYRIDKQQWEKKQEDVAVLTAMRGDET